MSRGIKLQAEPLRYLDGASFSSVYQQLTNNYFTQTGIKPCFQHNIRQLILTNNTDGTVMVLFEYDPKVVSAYTVAGVADYCALRMTPGQSLVLDITTNKAMGPDGFFLAMGDSIWVRDSDLAGDLGPTEGYFTASAFYALGDGGTI